MKVNFFERLSFTNTPTDSLCVADAVQALTHTQMGRIFSTPLDRAFSFNFGPSIYIAFVRFYLGLPPPVTVGGLTKQPGFDYSVQRCLASHGVHVSPFLDANGTHASANCPATQQERHKKHNALLRVIKVASREAGLTVSCEPDTHALLLCEFSKPDCRRIFPKATTPEYKKQFKELLAVIESVAAPNCTLSATEKQKVIQTQADKLPLIDPHAAKGLIIDFKITNDSTGEEKWGDVTVANTTSPSVVALEFKAVSDRYLSKTISDETKLPDVLRLDPSPVLLGREQSKKDKYSRLLLIAAKQFREGKRAKMPTFTPYAISNFGELSPAAAELQDWLSDQYRLKCADDGPRADGVTVQERVRNFRYKLLLRTLLVLAAGIGGMMCAAGAPWGAGLPA
jgi:hypothetical protein